MSLNETRQKQKNFKRSSKKSGVLAMRKFILPVLFLLLPVISSAQSSWYVQNSGTTKDLYSVFFINQNTGWTSGNNKLLKTSNSGYTWDSVTVGVNSDIRSVYFVNNNTGWVCGTNGVILKTTNSGLNWLNQTFNSLLTFASIYFISSDTGFVAGNGGLIYKTVNGGINWTSVNPGFPSTNFTQIKFINSLTGFCTGFFNTSRLIKTTNAGNTWFEISPALGFGLSFSFINELTGWTSGANGTSKTTNGGTNWIYTEFFDNLLNSIQFVNPLTGYCVGTSSKIFKTTNEGANWNVIYTGPFTVPNSIFAFDSNKVWACGTGGVIYYGGNSLVDTSLIKYFPLKVGNSWTYETTYELPPGTNNTKVTIISDTVINNIKYFKTAGVFPGFVSNIITADSLTGNIFCYFESQFCQRYPQRLLMDSLAGRLGDTVRRCHNPSIGKITDTSNYFLPWESIKSKKFYYSSLVDHSYTYGKGFGLVELVTSEGTSTPTRLKGCVIDGILYGDTAAFSPFKTYLPLKVGNSWTYRYTVFPSIDTVYTTTITSETTLNGIKYYTFNAGFPSVYGVNLIALDTITGNIFGYSSNSSCSRYSNRVLIDSLAARKNDTIKSCPQTLNGVCNDTLTIMKYGYSIKTKTFSNTYPLVIYPRRTYSEKFGIISASTNEIDYVSYTLKSCTINGITYSDSLKSISGIIKFSDNNQPASDGYVKAIKLNNSNGTIITLDSAQIGVNGTYTLTHLPIDSCDIVAYPNSEKEADFVPTFYPSTISWLNAVKVYTGNNPTNINISVYRKNEIQGMYSISGMIMPQTRNVTGLPGAIVYIKQGNYFRNFYLTNSSGHYDVHHLPAGNYEVIADRLGYIGAQQNAAISNSNLLNVNFTLIPIFTGIHSISNIVPEKFSLYQNYPNPFNPVTNIRFDIPKSSFVTIKIYNVLGKESAVLLNESKAAGSYEIDFDASTLTSGVYFYRLETESFTETKRMVILK